MKTIGSEPPIYVCTVHGVKVTFDRIKSKMIFTGSDERLVHIVASWARKRHEEQFREQLDWSARVNCCSVDKSAPISISS